MPYYSFENLDVWKRSCRIAEKVYKSLADCRDWGLKDQMTRSAVSIASNIAEGSERGSKPEFSRFLNIAKGSAAELRTQVYIAYRVNLISRENYQELVEELKQISKMIYSLINSIKKT